MPLDVSHVPMFGPLHQIMRAGQRCRKGRWLRKPEIEVLTADPYLAATPANHRDAQWLVNAWNQVNPHNRIIHIRGLFYLIVMAQPAILKPDGEPFINTHRNWLWLSQHAVKYARWLGYLPFDKVTDERNEAPYIPDPQRAINLRIEVAHGAEYSAPWRTTCPSLEIASFDARQPFRLVLLGEKSSLAQILLPIAKEHGAELLLPNGEVSDSMLYDACKNAAADGRPTVALYCSDFDPAGHQMPISAARKLQAFRDSLFPNIDLRLYPVALTKEQVEAWGLPDAPLKPGEKRSAKWKDATGKGQVEIDAAIALRPVELRQVVRDALAPFYDSGLQWRVQAAEQAWNEQIAEMLQADPEYVAACGQIAEAEILVKQAIGNFRAAQREAEAILNATLEAGDLPEPTLPEARLPEAPPALLDTREDWLTNTLRLKAHKLLDDMDDEE